jgi:hypothetical protein
MNRIGISRLILVLSLLAVISPGLGRVEIKRVKYQAEGKPGGGGA